MATRFTTIIVARKGLADAASNVAVAVAGLNHPEIK